MRGSRSAGVHGSTALIALFVAGAVALGVTVPALITPTGAAARSTSPETVRGVNQPKTPLETLGHGVKAQDVDPSSTLTLWLSLHQFANPRPNPNSITCPSATSCYAFAAGTALTSTGNGNWVSHALPTSPVLISQVSTASCPNATTCYALASGLAGATSVDTILVTTDGGSTWTEDTGATGEFELYSITCPDASTCYADGSQVVGYTDDYLVLSTTDGGSTWSGELYSVNVGELSCPSTTDCYAAGNNGLTSSGFLFTTADGGTTWVEAPAPSTVENLGSAACPAVDTCYVTAELQSTSAPVVLLTSDGGATWDIEDLPAGISEIGYQPITCPDLTDCYVPVRTSSGSYAILSTHGGSAWTESSFPTGVTTLNSVTCPDAQTCYAVMFGTAKAFDSDAVIIVTTNGGDSWSVQAQYLDVQIDELVCPSASVCQATGAVSGQQGSYVFGTSDGGAHWDSEPFGGTSPQSAIACTTSKVCFSAGGASVVSTTDAWSNSADLPVPSSTYGLDSIACPQTADCYAAGVEGVIRTTNGGASWSRVSLPTGAGVKYALSAITCSSATTCFAIGKRASGAGVVLTTTTGTTWSDVSPSLAPPLNAIACPTSLICYVVGGLTSDATGTVEITTDGGTSWTSSSIPASSPGSIACPDPSTCYTGGGTDMYVTSDSGSTWTPSTLPQPPIGASWQLVSMACTSTTTCYATANETELCPLPKDGPSTLASRQQGSQVLQCGQNFVPLSTTDGTNWVSGFVFASAQAGGIACPETSTCYTPGGENVLTNRQVPLEGGPIALEEALGGGFNICIPCLSKAIANLAQPVETSTGDFWHTFTDVSVPGRGYSLSLSRTYNSAAASTDGPFGYGWTFSYGMNLSGMGTGTVTLTQENGSQVQFDLVNGVYTADPRDQATLVANADGSWTVTRNATQTLTFNSSGQLTSETDLDGNTTTLSYSGTELSSVTDPAGRMLSFTWSGTHVASVTDPLGHVTTYSYDANGNLASVTNPDGDTTTFTYDSSHRMVTMRSPRGGVVKNTYDASGRVIRQSDAMHRVTKFSYSGDPESASGGTTLVTDPAGDVTQYVYQYGLMTSKTEAFGTPQAATWQYRYDPASVGPVAVADPDGNVTTTTYDARGNPLVVTDPLGNTTTKTYNAFNEPLTVTDADNVTTTYTYDANGNMTSKSTPLTSSTTTQTNCLSPTTAVPIAQVTCYAYGDPSHPGDMTSMTDADGNTWKYGYDRYGDQTSVVDPQGDRTTAKFNADGEKVSSVAANGYAAGNTPASFTTYYTYDKGGHVIKTVDPLGGVTTNTYDKDGNLITVTDADGHVTKYTYDLDDEQTEVQKGGVLTSETSYTPDGKTYEQTNGTGGVTTYTYDALGNEATITDPEGNETAFTYDGDGNRLTEQQPGGNCTASPATGCIFYTYDADNRLDTTTYSDGTTTDVTSTSYDGDGHRTSQELALPGGGSTSWSWDYNSLGQLVEVLEGTATVSYGYDLMGHVTSITYPNSEIVTMTYDKAGRETSVEDWLGHKMQFVYDADGNLTSEVFPKATDETDTFVYDHDDRMTSVRDTQSTNVLFSATYTRDADGQIVSDSSAPAGYTDYGYTAANQLCYVGSTPNQSCSSAPAGSASYTYDAAGNPIGYETVSAGTPSATSQAFDEGGELCWTASAQVTGSCTSPPSGATTYQYNAEGDLTTINSPTTGTTTLGYDQENRVISYSSGATSATYVYNADGLRLSKTVDGSTTSYVWDVSGGLSNLLSDGSSYYVYGPSGMPLEQITKKTALWIHHDQSGSTRLVTTTTGAVAATDTYDPYGNIVASTGDQSVTLLYGGQYQDSESGLYYLRARYYDPSVGAMLTVDPQVATTGSPYLYTFDNPLNGSDPTGLDCGWAPWDWGSCISDAATWVNQNASTISAVTGAAALIPEPFAPLLGAISVVTGADAAVHDYANGNIVGGTIALLSTVLGLGAEGDLLAGLNAESNANFWVNEASTNYGWQTALGYAQGFRQSAWMYQGWSGVSGLGAVGVGAVGTYWDARSCDG